MPSIVDSLSSMIGGDIVGRIGQQLGTDPATTSTAVSAALPILVSALAHRSSQEGGADALAGALAQHDGGVLDNVSGVIGSGGNADLLGQVLGPRSDAIANVLGRSSGLSSQSAAQLLAMLAPLVMGTLGRRVRDQGLDSAGLASMLGAEHQQIASANSPLTSMLSQALDRNHDGSMVDDVMRIAGGLFGGTK